MNKEEIHNILDRHLLQKSTKQDQAFLESWYNHQHQGLPEDYSLEERIEDSMLVWKSLNNSIIFKRARLWPRLAIAASIALAVGTAAFLMLKDRGIAQQQISSTIVPGTDRAYLTLSDGRRISLDTTSSGQLASDRGTQIRKTADGTIIYDASNLRDSPTDKTTYNTISTPNGGRYQIKLADGTKVWINAASALRFPASFHSLKQRRVELNGEAYFEVTKDSVHPFIVSSKMQTIEVRGTHFNVSAYPDDPFSRTTLVEGSVKILSSKGPIFLYPGQQAETTSGKTQLREVDINNAIDWKNDEFYFRDMDFKTAMRRIARWYDIEVEYTPGVDTNFEPGGWISRKSSLKSVLKMMESTGKVKFKAEGRRIIVTE